MKPGLATAALALSLLMVTSAFASADIPDPGSPTYTNRMLNGFVTPTVSPGELVKFSFNITNTYDDPSAIMQGAVLTMGVYRYSTQEVTLDVNSSFKNPPKIDGVGTEESRQMNPLYPGETVRVNVDIETSTHTPHGSYFSQSTYFMRFKLTFHLGSNITPILLQSKGYFTDEQWNTMVSFSADQSIVNTTYMHDLGVNGLLPDSAFGIKVPIPKWPLGVLIGVICGLCFLALYYFVLDNPGRYPKLEKRFYYLRGKLSELRSQLKNRRRK
jgi:hypothetical protein